MSGRRTSGRGTSMSATARKILREKKRRQKRGLPDHEDAEASRTVLWALLAIAVVVVGFVVWRIVR